MARNKHPEETVRLILDVAFRLFMEKGYENTSIQDIISGLGGLSKGAIYHHFKSKDDILVAVIDRMTAASICRPVQDDIFTVAPNFHNNPKLLFSLLHDTIEEVAPHYILPILRQGISDGSIGTAYPEQLAELILLAANIWMNPMIFDSSVEESCRKFMVLGQMLQGFGLDIVDGEMLEKLRELTAIYQNSRGDSGSAGQG